jgi:hypothetical protein
VNAAAGERIHLLAPELAPNDVERVALRAASHVAVG